MIPIGGLGEFGMNMLALRCNGEIVVIDAGVLFPGSEALGVDVIVPDLSYLIDHKTEIRGLVVTHGHEDHLGAVPYFLSQIDVPIYLTAFTEGLLRRKLDERPLRDAPRVNRIQAGDRVTLGCFEIAFLHVTHSTVDCVALAIDTPLGTVIHTGDFRIDHTPVDGPLFDLHAFAERGRQGVLLLLSDSTNAERPGFSPSERTVGPAFEDILTRTDGTVFISCFSSATHRVQQAIDLSIEHDRRIALIGRSLTTASEIAHELGRLHIPDGALIRPQDLSKLPRSERTVLISGTQGEPLSSLARASVGQHKQAVIHEGDAVILSARMIPGNERPIFRMIDHLYRRGAEVYYGSRNPPIHCSGHAAQEELKLILNLTKPKYFIPIHGEYRQLSMHGRLAGPLHDYGLEETFILQSGQKLVIDEAGAELGGDVPVGRIFIDVGTGDEIIEDLVIRDRRHLSEFGVIIPIVSIDRQSGKVQSEPEIVSRGFSVPEDGSELLSGALDSVVAAIEGSTQEETCDVGLMEEKVRSELRRYLSKKTSRSSRPLIVPVILEG